MFSDRDAMLQATSRRTAAIAIAVAVAVANISLERTKIGNDWPRSVQSSGKTARIQLFGPDKRDYDWAEFDLAQPTSSEGAQ